VEDLRNKHERLLLNAANRDLIGNLSTDAAQRETLRRLKTTASCATLISICLRGEVMSRFDKFVSF
jgi:hypothetical protein